MKIEQFVMAYKVEQDRIRAILPDGFESLRPVMRINTEIKDEKRAYIEFNTPVEYAGKRGWLNIGHWEGDDDKVSYSKENKTTVIETPFFKLTYTGTGTEGGCPAEKDNDGCFFIDEKINFKPSEKIGSNKEFCDCEFEWKFNDGDACGVSNRESIPAFFEEPKITYEKWEFSAENATAIECEKILGSYVVVFER